MAFIAARMSVLRGRPPGDALGISGSSRAHSASRRSLGYPSPADRSGGAPPSTLPFAITVNPVTVNHAIHRDATPFWVRFLSPTPRGGIPTQRVWKQREIAMLADSGWSETALES